jgi:HAD superfamily hydrolase (TIGR01509 family)
MNFRETALYTVERFGFDETPDDLMKEWNDMASYEYGHSIALKPHAGDYIKLLHSKNIKLAVATSSPAELCEAALINNGIRGLFDAVCASGAAARGKEFPDIFLRAAGELGAPPESCLVFEDILPAILSAKRARMSAWAIYDETSGDRWEEIKLASDGFIYDFIDAPLPV